ncbi:protein Fe65 homolog isoform X1 [Periplaneta americana]|uniref:protein Fe65 homolog isoform X1 n=1 Tax=Periplaneta americana TaxID=6978 RepID=UPI0037E927C4
MLCGEFLSRIGASPLSTVSLLQSSPAFGTRSPYFTLLTLCQGMAALTANPATVDDDDIYLENGLLSYENPNYHLDPARLDDALNSNTEQLYDDLYHELDAVCNLAATRATSKQAAEQQGSAGSGTPGRRGYAALDIGSMGVDVTTGPVTNLDTTNTDNHNNRSSESCLQHTTDPTSRALDNSNSLFHDNANLGGGGGGGGGMGRRPLDLTSSLRAKPDLIETAEQRASSNNICEKPVNLNTAGDDGSVPHIAGQLNNDLYAVPVKRRPPPQQQSSVSSNGGDSPKHSVDSPSSGDQSSDLENLPPGWEKHEDNDGPYYWHIKSGTIQREPPAMPPNSKTEPRRPLVKDAESQALNTYQQTGGNGGSVISSVTRSNTSSALEELDAGKKKEDRKEEMAFKRRSYPARAEPSESKGSERPIRFAVRSLGWVEIAEEDLTPERSSKAVNKCIVDLSFGRFDLLDVVGRWGDGKELFMDLDEGALKLIDPENLTVLNTQPIHTIRVWGVGRDNGRDFAYVARDRTTRKHMCHVFRCDIPARTIANTLRDICKKIMIERSLQQNLAKPIDIIGGSGSGGRSGLATRPTNLPTEHRRFHHRNGQALVTQSFPTPMEEPKKVLRAQYLGSTQVTRATGMDILNDAIERLVSTVPTEKWRSVNVAVAPSMISILNPSEENKLVAECRVRYLSFLGIGRNVKQCGFIMHTAQDLFIAHVFHCEPSSGALCKTVEAACKLRYQKCLDAHPQGLGRNQNNVQTPGGGAKGFGATLKSLVGSLTGRGSNRQFKGSSES